MPPNQPSFDRYGQLVRKVNAGTSPPPPVPLTEFLRARVYVPKVFGDYESEDEYREGRLPEVMMRSLLVLSLLLLSL